MSEKARHFLNWVLRSSLPTLSCLCLAGCDPFAIGVELQSECDTDADCEDGLFCTVNRCGSIDQWPLPSPRECFPPSDFDRRCLNPTPICDEEGRRCLPCENDAQCDDGSPCTDDSCTPETGECTSTFHCDDGVFCNGYESCDPSSGNCVVPNASPCGELLTCVEETESCLCFTDAQCADGTPCTREYCDLSNGQCYYESVTCNSVEDCPEGCNGRCDLTDHLCQPAQP